MHAPVIIELVDFNEIYGKGKGEAKEAAKKTRRSRGGSKKTETTKTEESKKEETTEAKAAE